MASTAAGSRSGPSPRLAGCVDGLLAPNSAASEPLRHTLDFVGAASQKEPGKGILPNSAAHWQSHWHASPAQCASQNLLKALETFAVSRRGTPEIPLQYVPGPPWRSGRPRRAGLCAAVPYTCPSGPGELL